jgi:DNA-binding LytR/AlgR family response regulator
MRGKLVRAIVAEDEKVLRDELVTHLAELWPALEILGSAKDGVEALALIQKRSPDIAFLDIQMPGMTGLEVARLAPDTCRIVFVTAFDNHAVAAFEQGAVDYLLKPYDLDRLRLALDRVQLRLETNRPDIQQVLDELARISARKTYLRWLRASKGHDVRLILVDDVCYFQADTKYTTVATSDGEAIIRTSLKQLREQLDPDIFWAIHRSTIVNVGAIRGITRSLDGSMQVLLKDRPERLTVSEKSRHLFRQM